MLRRTFTPWLSAQSLLFVCLYLGSQAATMAHVLLVPHERCAEHGEVVHGEASRDASGVAASPRRTADRVSTQARHEHSPHEHCGANVEVREERDVVSTRVNHARIATTDAVRSPASNVARSVGILHVAPKSSPPA